MTTYTRWYRVGTVSCTKDGVKITGKDTQWTAGQLSPGDMFTTDNGQSFYEIFTVDSDTSITLKTPYTGSTVTGSSYAVVRQFNATMSAKVAAWASKLLLDFDTYINTDLQTIQGKDAYEVAVDAGFTGTRAEWLEDLKAGGEWVQTRNRLTELETKVTAAGNTATGAQSLIGGLGGLHTTDKNTLVGAINEVDTHADTNASNMGALTNLKTSAKSSIVAAINEVDTHADENAATIGALTGLTTDSKASIVAAVNEVDSHTDTNSSAIGALASLSTSAKTNVVSAVNEVNTKADTTAAGLGTLSNLKTNTKSDAVSALNELQGEVATHTTNIAGLTVRSGSHPLWRLRNTQMRNKDLGYPTAEIIAKIKAGNFEDLYLGDMFTIDAAHWKEIRESWCLEEYPDLQWLNARDSPYFQIVGFNATSVTLYPGHISFLATPYWGSEEGDKPCGFLGSKAWEMTTPVLGVCEQIFGAENLVSWWEPYCTTAVPGETSCTSTQVNSKIHIATIHQLGWDLGDYQAHKFVTPDSTPAYERDVLPLFKIRARGRDHMSGGTATFSNKATDGSENVYQAGHILADVTANGQYFPLWRSVRWADDNYKGPLWVLSSNTTKLYWGQTAWGVIAPLIRVGK